ncbi:16903_t:CDS:2 [Racocetra fulgida]|uniref:16903_t:CDS:1 n=1 Tax=Racocetra fulgida TaxID=60492 RepID=A0A9N9H3U2_9GLOM|nr:16903_t:CDS:2 [Racocetra fulgida]
MIYIDDVTYNASDPSMSIDIRAIDSEDEISTEQLEKRLDLLQLFLRDYVVNVQYLEKLQQSNTSNTVTDEEPDNDKHI